MPTGYGKRSSWTVNRMARRRRAKSSRGNKETRAALAECDEKTAELEAQIAETAKTVESVEVLAKLIEELKAASDAERCEFELHPGRAR